MTIQNNTQKIAIASIFLILAIFIFSYTSFRYVELPIREVLTESDGIKLDNSFYWEKFLTFNFLLKLIFIYPPKILFIILSLRAGSYFLNINFKLSEILATVILLELIFFLPDLLKIIWYLLLNISPNVETNYLFSLSLYSIFNGKDFLPFSYLFSFVSVFEVFYVLILSSKIHEITNESFPKSLKLVLFAYVLPFFIWSLAVSLFSLMFSN